MTIVDQLYSYKYLIRQTGIRCKTTRSIGRILLSPQNTLNRDLRFFELHKTKNAYSLENKQQTRYLYAAIIELGVSFCQSLWF